MSTRDLINAIAAGDAIEIENAFNSVMAEKISSRIDELRIDVAQNLFAEEVEEIEEEVEDLDEASIHAMQIGDKEYKSWEAKADKMRHDAGVRAAKSGISRNKNPHRKSPKSTAFHAWNKGHDSVTGYRKEEFDIISEEEYLALSEEEQSEFEQITELSTNLIARYRAKANDAYINHDDNISAHYKLAKKASKAGDKETEKHHQDAADKEWKTYWKRKKGEHQARKKLTSRGAKWDQKVYSGDRM